MPDFRENLGFGVVSGDLGPQKGFVQIAKKPFPILSAPDRRNRNC